uniref:TFIIH C1-like domain-containing protein n=1 Tax=Arcella intermedia TaxID=1963864 RepID=A0A6B2L887_9EUKA
MGKRDFSTTRIELVLSGLKHFIPKYFEANPLSQLQLVQTRGGLAHMLSTLSGNKQQHVNALQQLSALTGEASLQNSLEVSLSSLSNVPQYGTREVLILLGTLTSCDPSDIKKTIKKLIKRNITVNIIGLSAEVFICKKICECTHGIYSVVRNEKHFEKLILEYVLPPPASSHQQEVRESNFLVMGFPRYIIQELIPAGQLPLLSYTLCACHKTPSSSGYLCPRCDNKICNIPATCNICGLLLVSSLDLSQSYHFLNPLQPFQIVEMGTTSTNFDDSESEEEDIVTNQNCAACNENLFGKLKMSCPKCSSLFCEVCNSFLHEVLSHCPTCLNQ